MKTIKCSVHPRTCFTFVLISFFLYFTGVFSSNGPHPSDIAPSSYANKLFRAVTIPLISPGCNRTNIQNASLKCFESSTLFFDKGRFTCRVENDWCSGQTHKLRVRVLEYQTPITNSYKKRPMTRVLSATTESFSDSFSTYQRSKCNPFFFYMELCVRNKGIARPLCITSNLVEIPRSPVPVPVLAFRPPYELRIAPGNSVKIVTKIINNSIEDTGISDGAYDSKTDRFLLRSVVKSQHGVMLKRTKLREATASVITISHEDTKGWRRKDFDNATVFMTFAIPSCPSQEGSFQQYFTTKIFINDMEPSLVRQDTQLPEFEQPKFPMGSFSDSVKINVTATNRGGGLLQGGRTTKLTYQWSSRGGGSIINPTYPYLLEGENTAVLRLDKSRCPKRRAILHTPYYVGNLYYFVDVCNTYGCKRSQKIPTVSVSYPPLRKQCYRSTKKLLTP